MVTRRKRPQDKQFLKKLGKRIEGIIIDKRGYSSLDAFSLEFSDLIAKPTLYAICKGERDMKITTLIGLAEALEMSLMDLISGIDNVPSHIKRRV
jgi:hypothetical protein